MNRIAYLRGLALHGAKLTFSVSINGSTGIQKVKVVVDPREHIPMQLQYCTISMLDWLLELNNTHHIADKGHRHSSGVSEVAFYILKVASSINRTEPPERSSVPSPPIYEQPNSVRRLASKALESNAALDSGRHIVQKRSFLNREPEHLTMLTSEWVPAPTLHYAEPVEPDYEQGNVMTSPASHLASGFLSISESTSEAMLKQESELFTSFSRLSLPNMELLSIKDGLQVVCVSRHLCTVTSELLAIHVRNSGGNIDDASISLG